jgi:hypothetical protein
MTEPDIEAEATASDDARLDEVQRKIDEAREAAEDDGILIEDDEPRYYESGSIKPELDDQAITPPG